MNKREQNLELRNVELEKELAEKNRELEIEASLERVRTVAMGMIKPDDLLSICETMFFELEKLGFNDLRNAMINIHYSDKNYLLNYEFRESVGKTVVKVIYNSHPIVNNLVHHAQEPGEGFTEQVYTGETLEEWKAFRKGNGEEDDPRLDNISALYYYFYSIGTGSVGVSMFSVANAWQLEVLKRFRNVFDLSYKRYIDITSAAAQAHEAQIELGLERVRARAMAMQQSEELSELVALLITELSKLDMALSWCLVTLLDEPSWSARVWRANSQLDQAPQSYYLPFADHPFQKAIMQAWKERQEKWSYVLTGDEKKAMDDYMFTKTDYSRLPQQVQGGIRAADPAYFYFSFGNFGGLQVGGPKQLSDESLNILARFGKVFDLTYTRFNDLKQAEEQARESKIELALERVRARTMAMQHSDELAETAYILFQQFRELGENPDQATIGIVNEAEAIIEYWVTIHGNQTNRVYKFPTSEPDVTNKIYTAWKAGEASLVIDLEGKALHDFSKFRESMGGAGYNPDEKRRIINLAFFSKGLINVQSTVERSVESLRLLERFAKVFEGTYTRFLDLKNAETQARESQIQLGLERVRARAMAMQRSNEMADMVTAVFKELTHLDLALTRCAIVIMDADGQAGREWTAEMDQSAISHYVKYPDFPYNKALRKAWAEKLGEWHYELAGEEMKELTRYLINETEYSHIPEPVKAIMLATDRIILSHSFANFGSMRADTLEPLSSESIGILRRFAQAFDLCYTRFNDLKIAERHAIQAAEDLVKLQAEKKRTEDALTELRLTQKQLIQSEKMASLGELTAGIAHEIQNPLNFVNNFSEVSVELLAELKEEVEAGNTEDVVAIANDLVQNLEKIRHHGKRADGIVKGMLEHSRASTGQKELTDLNKLADEYLRLAYHGLRAKDKSFNAELITHFDEKLPLVNIVAQDIGRVLINLFNNAFYAVNQKAKTAGSDYKPTVEVNISVAGDQMEINVMDNGNGIPENIKDKIMQPFFTTKPTGEGTGLGLSLSYDIVVKGHGGTLRVNSAEDRGSEFIIQFPID